MRLLLNTLLAALLITPLTPCGAARAGSLHIYTEPARLNQYGPNGELSGFTTDLVRELMRRSGISGEFEEVPWKRAYLAVQNSPEAAIFPAYRIPEREGLFQWSDPILKAQWMFYKRKGSPLRLESLDDARRVGKIAVVGGDARKIYLESRGFPNLEVVGVDISCWRMLARGRVDLVTGSNLVGLIRDEEYEKLMPFVEPALLLGEFTMHVGFSLQTSPELIQAWNAALGGMVRDGTYAAHYRRYFPTDEFSPYPLPPLN